MKKEIARYTCLLLVFCAAFCMGICSVTTAAEFDEQTVIVVMKPSASYIRLMSDDIMQSFEGIDIDSVRTIAKLPANGFTLYSAGFTQREMLCIKLKESSEDKVLEAIDALNNMNSVEYAQPNYIYHLDADVNDAYRSEQYSLDKVGAPAVWEMNIDCSETVVAVLDSGACVDHEDLKDNLWVGAEGNSGWDFIDNDPVPDDTVGHGTHVAGIISAVTNNSVGIASLARNAKIAPLKVADAYGCDTATICDALQYILDYEKKYGKTFSVINCSFGVSYYDRVFEELLKQCGDKVIVAAAGNTDAEKFKNIDEKSNTQYPACYNLDNIICVANSTENDELYETSRYGVINVDIAAPGAGILSTYIGEDNLNSTYYSLSGTSMSTPLVSSAFAALLAKCPELTAKEAIEYILYGADYAEALDGYVSGGRRLNAYKSIVAADAGILAPSPSPTLMAIPTATPTPTPIPTATPTAIPTSSPTPIPDYDITPIGEYSNILAIHRCGDELDITVESREGLTGDAAKITLYTAVYEDGKLHELNAEEFNLMEIDGLGFYLTDYIDENQKAKLFIWNSLQSPLIEAITV